MSYKMGSKGSVLNRILVLGLGGYGEKALNHLVRTGIEGVNFILADKYLRTGNSTFSHKQIFLETDLSKTEDLNSLKLTSAFKKDRQKIRQVLQGSDIVFTVVGIGGQTGTFWIPVVVRLCKRMGILNINIIKKPLYSQTSRIRMRSEKGIENLTRVGCTFFVIQPETHTLWSGPYVLDRFELENCNQQQWEITDIIKGITDIYHNPLTRLNLDERKRLFLNKGLAAMAIGMASSPGRAEIAAQKAIDRLSYYGNHLCNFPQILGSLTADSFLDFKEVTEAVEMVKKKSRNKAVINWEKVSDDSMGEALKLTVFALGGTYPTYTWYKTIFCQVDHLDFSSRLEGLAKDIGCCVFYGEKDSPDILSCSRFISIVDRGLIETNYWKIYLDYHDVTFDDTPIIIVDNLHYMGIPKHKNIKFINPDNPLAFEEIATYIRKIRFIPLKVLDKTSRQKKGGPKSAYKRIP